MVKVVSGLLAAAVGALVLAAAGVAATSTVLIKSTGFSPSSITVNHGDKVLFATDWPVTRYDRVFAELEEVLKLEEPVKRKFMHDNALRAFKLG